MSLKRPADSGLSDDESVQKRARTVEDTILPVPLLYQEGKEVLCIYLWYPGRVDEETRRIIYKGLRGPNDMAWISFLQGDEEDFTDVLPKDFLDLKPKDLGVVKAKDFFSFDDCFSPDE